MRGKTSQLSCAVLWVILIIALASTAVAASKPPRPGRDHAVYFAGTPNELNVYRVYGAKDGKTLMLLGGIQGDEPGGFLSADLYADISLAKGNLIVVPRANFYSIIMNHRGPDGDMNRQFGDPITVRRHKEIIKILKSLMAEADILLNLHDGSGFYRPTYESPMANPKRYGQSLIADTAVYKCSDGRVLDLKAMALRVLSRVNAQIDSPRYHILFNNHRTSSPNSMHKEQRKSATYYALTRCNIPAFGVESSKSLPSTAMKISHHKLVINSFMQELGIVTENPSDHLAKPLLKYLVIGVNDHMPVVVPKGADISVRPGDRLQVLHIEANYERGITCDLLGAGSVNDTRRPFTIRKPTTIVVRKDHQEIGKVAVRLSTKSPPLTAIRSKLLYFLIDLGGERRVVADNEKITVVRGDTITLVDLLSNLPDQSNIHVNFKGFVPSGARNAGEDRGWKVNTGQDLMQRYSLCGRGSPAGQECYQVVATQGRRKIGSIIVRVVPARMHYMVLRQGNGHPLVYKDGETVFTKPDQRLEVVDLKTNVAIPAELSLALRSGKRTVALPEASFSTGAEPYHGLAAGKKDGVSLLVKRHDRTIGHVRIKLGESPNAGK